MNKIEKFQITGMTISGFKSYEKSTELVFGDPTVITGGNGRAKRASRTRLPLLSPDFLSSGSVVWTGCIMRAPPTYSFRCVFWMRTSHRMS